MENSRRTHVADEPSNGMAAKDKQENNLSENETRSAATDENTEQNKERPLPKIRPNLHPHGYKMFSNRSSGDDIPKTSTGI